MNTPSDHGLDFDAVATKLQEMLNTNHGWARFAVMHDDWSGALMVQMGDVGPCLAVEMTEGGGLAVLGQDTRATDVFASELTIAASRGMVIAWLMGAVNAWANSQ